MKETKWKILEEWRAVDGEKCEKCGEEKSKVSDDNIYLYKIENKETGEQLIVCGSCGHKIEPDPF
ncbi:protein of unknown function [endosymbiont DhMRE of Dentiscutata heterogama]|uniref:hypothetical protein n=1 Tax=endosymbiont DhMRE of Dentiscutata heterogama TaxID=1609546 RepID=UPI000629DA6C|nr:hypothetical protein [endosymbiont DhMRE of Dentiscutata heterogama]CFW93331.1 protein of unknown function [endosymbiont DhMRE of Dentiscutata heterogama]